MCPGTRLPHSEQLWSLGARQRFAPRRIFCFILDTLRFGTAIILGLYWTVGV